MIPGQNYYAVVPQQCCVPAQNPSVNAVKIDIHNPQAYGAGATTTGNQAATCPNGIYSYPYVPVYPTQQQQQQVLPPYIAPLPYPQPPYLVPQQTQQQQTIQTQPVIIPAMTTTQSQQTVTNPAAPVVPTPQVMQQTVTNPVTPVVPTPQVIQQTQTIPSVVPVIPTPQVTQTQTQTVTPVVPATTQSIPIPIPVPTPLPPVAPVPPQPIVNENVVNGQTQSVTPANTISSDAKPVEAVKPVETAPKEKVDVAGIINNLSSTDLDAQIAALQKITNIAQNDKEQGKSFFDPTVFGKLTEIINADTSTLKGPAPGQVSDVNNLTPLEKAEINKQCAIYTLSILQKNFRDEIDKEMAAKGQPNLPFTEIPFIKEGIVNNLKDNPNPAVREACLNALKFMAKPEDKDVLTALYDISAKHDSNPEVRAAATKYLSEIAA